MQKTFLLCVSLSLCYLAPGMELTDNAEQIYLSKLDIIVKDFTEKKQSIYLELSNTFKDIENSINSDLGLTFDDKQSKISVIRKKLVELHMLDKSTLPIPILSPVGRWLAETPNIPGGRNYIILSNAILYNNVQIGTWTMEGNNLKLIWKNSKKEDTLVINKNKFIGANCILSEGGEEKKEQKEQKKQEPTGKFIGKWKLGHMGDKWPPSPILEITFETGEYVATEISEGKWKSRCVIIDTNTISFDWGQSTVPFELTSINGIKKLTQWQDKEKTKRWWIRILSSNDLPKVIK